VLGERLRTGLEDLRELDVSIRGSLLESPSTKASKRLLGAVLSVICFEEATFDCTLPEEPMRDLGLPQAVYVASASTALLESLKGKSESTFDTSPEAKSNCGISSSGMIILSSNSFSCVLELFIVQPLSSPKNDLSQLDSESSK
jgi:hypothetical protein